MKKTCVVCGNEFEAAQSNYIICSNECRKKRQKEYYANLKKKGLSNVNSYINTYEKKYKAAHKRKVRCRFCGENILPKYNNGRFHRTQYHDECLISKGIEALKNGEKIGTSNTLRIVTNKGFTKRELVDIANERGIEI